VSDACRARGMARRGPRTSALFALALALAFAAVGLGTAAALSAAPTPALPQQAIAPDASMQTAIQRAAAAQTEAEFSDAARALAELAGAQHNTIVPQLVYFAMQQHDTRPAMVPAALRARLAISDTEMIEALIPYLDTPDATLRAQLYNWLGAADAPHGGAPDFDVYRPILAARRDAPPRGLIRYLYETDPDGAVHVLIDSIEDARARTTWTQAQAPITAAWVSERSAHPDAALIAAARPAVITLAASEVWWLRLYAAASLRAMPALRTPDLAAQLRSDPDPLVRAFASSGS